MTCQPKEREISFKFPHKSESYGLQFIRKKQLNERFLTTKLLASN